MDNLAELVLDHIALLMFGSDDQIDPDYQCSAVAALPDFLARLSEQEKEALSFAADRRLRRIREMFTEACAQSSSAEGTEVEFLNSVATGLLFQRL